jgi:hypothetical protein
MINPDKYSPEITNIYLYANTPFYLFRKIKNSNFALWAVENIDTSEILSTIDSLLGKDSLEPDEIALAYSLLVVLGLKNFTSFDKLNLEKLTWHKEIVEYIRAEIGSFSNSFVSNSITGRTISPVNEYSTISAFLPSDSAAETNYLIFNAQPKEEPNAQGH